MESSIETVKVFPKFLDENLCGQLINIYKNKEGSFSEALPDNGVGEMYDHLFLAEDSPVTLDLKEKFWECLINFLAPNFCEYASVLEVRALDILDCTNNGSPMHYDGLIHAGNVRPITGLLYLNDNFEGGNILFPLQNLHVKPEAGTLVLFPTLYMYPHQVIYCKGTRFMMRVNYYHKIQEKYQ